MDIDGGMKSDIYDSMAEGVAGAACVICFMTQAYQDSANCKLELKFAQQSGVPIIPVMMQPDFTAKGWLGILTAGAIWTPMYEPASVAPGIDKLVDQIKLVCPTSTTSSSSFEGGQPFAMASGDFTFDEMREELERLRGTTGSGAAEPELFVLPANVPPAPPGLFVTERMEAVSDAVLSGTSPTQVGFCGMGGIGKTTVSSWIAHQPAVRKSFKIMLWVTLGQTPDIDRSVALRCVALRMFKWLLAQ